MYGQYRAQGTLQMMLSPVATPGNDDYSLRVPLSGGVPTTQAFTLTGATNDASDATIEGYSFPSVWYSWTAPQAGGTFTLTTLGSPVPVWLAVYRAETAVAHRTLVRQVLIAFSALLES